MVWSRSAVEKIRDTVQYVASLPRNNADGRAARPVPQSPEIRILDVTSATADGDGYWPANLKTYTVGTGFSTDSAVVTTTLDGSAPTTGKQSGMWIGANSSGTPLFLLLGDGAAAAGGGGGTTGYDWTYYTQAGTASYIPHFSYPTATGVYYPVAPYGVGISPVTGGGTYYSSDKLVAMPYIHPLGGEIDKVGVAIGSAYDSGSKLRLGIYDNSSVSDLYPTNLLWASSELSIDTAADVVETLGTAFTAAPGHLYWFAWLASGTGTGWYGSIRLYQGGFLGSGTIGGLASSASWVPTPTLLANYPSGTSYGALPDPFPSGAYNQFTSDGMPLIAVHFSSVG